MKWVSSEHRDVQDHHYIPDISADCYDWTGNLFSESESEK
jgi:hypothetical protein